MTPYTLPEPTYSNPLAGCYFDGYTSDQMQAAFAAGAASRDAEVEALRADAARIKTSARLLDDVVSEKFPIGQTDYQQEIAMIPPSVWVKVKKLAAEILRAAIAAEATK